MHQSISKLAGFGIGDKLCGNFGGLCNADCGSLFNLRCNNQVIKLTDCFKLNFWDDLIEGLNEYQYISNSFHYNNAES